MWHYRRAILSQTGCQLTIWMITQRTTSTIYFSKRKYLLWMKLKKSWIHFQMKARLIKAKRNRSSLCKNKLLAILSMKMDRMLLLQAISLSWRYIAWSLTPISIPILSFNRKIISHKSIILKFRCSRKKKKKKETK